MIQRNSSISMLLRDRRGQKSNRHEAGGKVPKSGVQTLVPFSLSLPLFFGFDETRLPLGINLNIKREGCESQIADPGGKRETPTNNLREPLAGRGRATRILS